MAARTAQPSLTAAWRAKIKTSMLINRLQDFASGKHGVEMSRSQVAAALGLLRKAVPDLSSVDLGNVDGQPLQVSIVKFNDLADDDKPIER